MAHMLLKARVCLAEEERLNRSFPLMQARLDHEVGKITSFSVSGRILLSQRMREAITIKQEAMNATKPHQPPCVQPHNMRTSFFVEFLLI